MSNQRTLSLNQLDRYAEKSYSPVMGVSEKEREYFRRVGAVKEALRSESLAAHQGLSIDERLRRSGALYLRYRHAARERTDDPSPYYKRARALGLYKG